MADLLDQAIEDAVSNPAAAELRRKSMRFEELRKSVAWSELREELKQRRQRVVEVLGDRLLRGEDAAKIRDAARYSKGFLDGAEAVLERPEEVEQQLEQLIETSYAKIKFELLTQAEEESPYA